MGAYKAVMDIGTNSCRLIIAECFDQRDITLAREARVTRVGEGIGRGAVEISPAAMDRTIAALTDYRALIDKYPVESARLLGTQALREAGNSQALADKIKEKTGFELEIISGAEEARLSYMGVTRGAPVFADISPLVLDIGAGSTEIVYGETSASGELVIRGESAPVGCLRLLENPMGDRSLLQSLKEGWNHVKMPDGAEKDAPLVAVGGTATTFGAIHTGMTSYDPDAMLGLRVDIGRTREILDMLERMSPADRLSLPGMRPGREDVMPWGLRILLAAMRYCGRESVLICDRDLLYGALYH